MATPAVASTVHTCALNTAGAVKCWGYNGDGAARQRHHHRLLHPRPGHWPHQRRQAIAAGGGHACALTTGGGVQCWGSNAIGQLGNGTTTDSTTPVQVSGLTSGVQAIAAGGAHACALTTAGGVKCWGYNGDGELGNGTTTDSTTPVQVSGLTSGVQAIVAGGGTTLRGDHRRHVQCWGYNGERRARQRHHHRLATPVPGQRPHQRCGEPHHRRGPHAAR